MKNSPQKTNEIILHLKTTIIEESLPILIDEFYKNGKDHFSNKLHKIYNIAVIFILRLIIIMIVEDRFSVQINSEYPQYVVLRKRIENAYEDHKSFGDSIYNLFKSFQELCQRLRLPSSSSHGIPWKSWIFNIKHDVFIDQAQISDHSMARLIDSLSRFAVSDDVSVWINYSTLPPAFLGEIYELTLQYNISNNSKGLTLTSAEGRKDNQKFSGSYYSPRYAVQYLTNNALNDILMRINQNFQSEIEILQSNTEDGYEEKIKKLREIDPLAKLLELKILDPAVGTGLFLLETFNVLKKWARQIFSTFYGLMGQEYRFEPLVSHNLRSSRDHFEWLILKHCLYGIDLDPIAVDITKFSLWITSSAHPMDYSYLDNRICVGNPLLGVRWCDVRQFLSRIRIKDDLVYSMLRQGNREIMKLVFDICQWTRIHCALNDISLQGRVIESILSLLKGSKLESPTPLLKEVMNEAKNLQYFHTDAEFWDWDDNSSALDQGFDLVITNPPYGAYIPPKLKKYYKNLYRTHKDSAAYFLVFILTISKRFGLILPKSFAFYSQWRDVRAVLLSKTRIRNVLDIGLSFANVNFETIGLIGGLTEYQKPKKQVEIAVAHPNNRLALRKVIRADHSIPSDFYHKNEVLLFRGMSSNELDVVKRISLSSVPLGEIIGSKRCIFRGMYIPNKVKRTVITDLTYSLKSLLRTKTDGQYVWIDRVPHVKSYQIIRYHLLDLSSDRHLRLRKRADKILKRRLFLKVLRGNRLVAYVDPNGDLCTTEKLVNIILPKNSLYSLHFLCGIINSPIPSFYLANVLFSKTTETSRVMDFPYSSKIPIPVIKFDTPKSKLQQFRNYVKKSIDAILAFDGPPRSGLKNEIVKSIQKGINLYMEAHEDHGYHDAVAITVQNIIKMKIKVQELQQGFVERLQTHFQTEAAYETKLIEREASIRLMEVVGIKKWPEIRKTIQRSYYISEAENLKVHESYQNVSSRIQILNKRTDILGDSVDILSVLCFGLNISHQQIVLESLRKNRK
ncbi:MAG: Eco57I restriction-modification methylase domain-containing protein [Candidatus Heimdallarchaeota archaeon]